MQNFLINIQTGEQYKQRFSEIDIAKALGILCVFIGHRTGGALHNYVYLFHMPLFFILSGCMIREEKISWSHKFLRDSKLFSSYLVYSIIFIIFSLVKSPSLFSFLENVAYSCTFYGIHTLWFLSSLWIAKLIIRFLFNINAHIIRHVSVVLIYVVCYWTSIFLRKVDYNGVVEQLLRTLSLAFVRAGVILIFVYLGFVMKNYIFSFFNYFKQHIILTTVVIIVTGVILISFTPFEAVDYHLLRNGLFFLDILYGVIGTVLILSIAIIIARFFKWLTRFLAFVGKNSIHYMASEFYGFSVTGPLRMLLGWSTYVEYIGLGVYFVLLNFAIWLLGPIIDNVIHILNNKINILASKVCKNENK